MDSDPNLPLEIIENNNKITDYCPNSSRHLPICNFSEKPRYSRETAICNLLSVTVLVSSNNYKLDSCRSKTL